MPTPSRSQPSAPAQDSPQEMMTLTQLLKRMKVSRMTGRDYIMSKLLGWGFSIGDIKHSTASVSGRDYFWLDKTRAEEIIAQHLKLLPRTFTEPKVGPAYRDKKSGKTKK